MAKIKRTVEMKFWELMKHVAENDIKDARFYGKSSYIDIEQGSLMVHGRHWFNPELKFKVEIAEEITEETRLKTVIHVDADGDVYQHRNQNIIWVKDFHKNSSPDEELRFIYLQNADGSIGDLIWMKEKGLVR